MMERTNQQTNKQTNDCRSEQSNDLLRMNVCMKECVDDCVNESKHACRGLDPEEPVQSTARLCCFRDLEVTVCPVATTTLLA